MRRCGRSLLVLLLFGGVAAAAPRIGDPMPTVQVTDTEGRTRALPFEREALVICWEDDRSSKIKQPAHAVVGRYSDRVGHPFELVLVADLERWNFWPARGRALESVKKKEAETHSIVWVDLKGALRKAFGLRKAESAFVVVDRDGRIRYLAQGLLDEAQRRELDAAIASLGAVPAPGR